MKGDLGWGTSNPDCVYPRGATLGQTMHSVLLQGNNSEAFFLILILLEGLICRARKFCMCSH